MNCILSFLIVGIFALSSMEARGSDVVLEGFGALRDASEKQSLYSVKFEHIERSKKPYATSIVHQSLEGNEIAHEKVVFQDGKLSEYVLVHSQRGVEASVKIAGGNVEVHWMENGIAKQARFVNTENLVVGASVLAYMGQRIHEVEAGKPVALRLVVPEKLKIFEFHMKRVEDNCLANGADLCVELVIANPFLRAFVKRSLIAFHKRNGRYAVSAMEAPSLVSKNSGAKFQEFLARIDYSCAYK